MKEPFTNSLKKLSFLFGFICLMSTAKAQTDSIVINVGDFAFSGYAVNEVVVPIAPPFGTITDFKVSFDYETTGGLNSNVLIVCLFDSLNQRVCLGNSGWFPAGSFNLGDWAFSGSASTNYNDSANIPATNYLTNNGLLTVTVLRSTTSTIASEYNDLTLTLFGNFSPPPVPTLGEWGLIFLSLSFLLLITITIKFPFLLITPNANDFRSFLETLKSPKLLYTFLALAGIYALAVIPLFLILGSFTFWDIPMGLLACSIVSVWWQVLNINSVQAVQNLK